MAPADTLAAMEPAPLSQNTIGFREGKGIVFLVMDAVYLLLVFGWTLFLPPLGRDYAALSGFAPFGDMVPLYHAVNLVLLYALMVLVFFLTRLATGGPWWLGSVAAVVLMAHPVKAEAVLNLSGMKDLFPTILSLTALLAYGCARRRPGWMNSSLAALLFSGATLLVPGQGGLLVAMVAWEAFIVPREQRRMAVMLPFLGLAALGWILHPPVLVSGNFALSGAFWPLLHLVYPMGLLPETVAAFDAQPFLPVVVFTGTVLAVLALSRKLCHPAFKFGILAAAGFALFGENRPVDPVHLIGGGRMLPALALFTVALAGLFHKVMHHPAWPKPTVWVTSMLCVVLMILQVQANLAWIRAGQAVDAFRRAAVTAAAQHPGERLAVFPDFRYCAGAPVQFAESVRHTTPFGRAFPVEVVASYDPDALDYGSFCLLEYTPRSAGFAATVQGPFSVVGPGGRRINPNHAPSWNWLQWLAPRDKTMPKRTVEVHIVPEGEPFPATRIGHP